MTRALLIAKLLLALYSAVASGEPPRAVVKGPAEIEPTQLGIFKTHDSIGEHFAFSVYHHGGSAPDPSNQEQIAAALALLERQGYRVVAPEMEADYYVSPDGKELVVPPVPGRHYVIFLAAANAEGVHTTVFQSRVKGGGGPKPPPDSGPNPGPDPPPSFDLSAQARQWIVQVPAAARNEPITHPISGETMTRQAAVARTFREVGQVAAQVGSFEAVDLMLTVGLAPAMGERANDWRGFAEKADAALEGVKAKGATVAQYGAAIKSIGEGLQ